MDRKVDKEKYRRLFVDEARENLNSYSSELVAMAGMASKVESADEAGRRAALDAVFRAAHSLKGMAASMGFGPFTEVAHALEDLADQGRQGVVLDEDAIDLLQESGDLLSEMVDQIESRDEAGLEAGDLPERLRRQQATLKSDSASPEALAQATPVADPIALFRAQAATGKVLLVKMDQAAANSNVRAFMAHRALSNLAGYQRTQPEVSEIKTGAAGGVFGLLFSSATSEALLGDEALLDDAALVAKATAQAEVASAQVINLESETESAPKESAPMESEREARAAPDLGAAPATASAPESSIPIAAAEENDDDDAPGERVLEVLVDERGQLPQVRAFMIHRAASNLPGYLRTEPAVSDIRRGAIAGWTLHFTFAGDADPDALIAQLGQEQGVKSARLVHASSAKPGDQEEQRSRPSDDRTVRIRTVLLDDFIDSVGELLIARSRLQALATRLDAPELGDLVDEIARMTRHLHDRVVSARMTPLASITERFPPLVRSLARKLKKKVDFKIEGAEIELDRAILDELGTPLIHMLRNAVDHAHEGSEAREKAGKPATMRMELVASRDRDYVLLELSDDGGGINADKVRARAIDRELISVEQAAAMTEAEAVELICTPGFTTAAEVSETSGRGVGMDVVKSTLEKLGGTLRIRSEFGKGTTFTLRMPLTVAIIQVLVVEAGDEEACVYAIPIGRVDRAINIVPSAVRESHGQRHLIMGDDLIPLFDLSLALGFETAVRRSGTAILVGEEDEARAFSVAAVLGQEEVVVKPLGAPLSEIDYLSGAALLADGRTAYILEPTRLTR